MDKIFIALSENTTVGKSILSWAFNNFVPNQTTIVIVHACTPDVEVPQPTVSEVHPIKLAKEKREQIESIIRAYLSDCEEHEFKAEALVVDANIIDQGIVDLIHQYGVNKLIMGAGTPSQARAQMSNISNTVMNNAGLSCRISFIHDGDLLCTSDSCSLTQRDRKRNKRSHTVSRNQGLKFGIRAETIMGSELGKKVSMFLNKSFRNK